MIYPRPLKKVREKITPFSQEDKIPTFNLGSGTADSTTVLHGDGTWQPEAEGLPPGGTAGQLLAKESDTNYDVTWVDQAPAASYTSVLKHTVKAGENLVKGQAVYVSSADGTNMVVSKASNTTEATSSKTMGLIAQNLSTNGKGFVITEGLLDGLDTGSTVAGAPVWLGVNGELIYGLVGKPYAPAHLVFIGIVTRANNSNGEIFVKVQNGFELDELHDVDLKSIPPTDGQVLQFDGATGLWKNNTLSTGLTVGSTAISSGTDGRVLFQNGGVLQQSANLFWDNTNGRLGVGTSTPGNTLVVRSPNTLGIELINILNSKSWKVNINSNDFFITETAVGNPFIIKAGGNVLINTTTDAGFRLNVNGTARFGATTVTAPGALSTDIAFRVRNSANTLDIIRAQGDGSVFVGLGAGNVNTGANNSFFGIDAGRNNTTGDNNTAIGASALFNNTTGRRNSAVSTQSLWLNTTGRDNTAYGIGSLQNNTTGSSNIAIGLFAGRYIADETTANTITNNSVFLGAFTKAQADNQTNQIVIGYNAIGLGSNTAVIGNSSTTLFRPFGNVAIGADTAGARLDVRAQGALSTDIAFRVRNSANTGDLLNVAGNGSVVLSSLTAVSGIAISQPAGQYYPTLSFRNNGGANQGSIFGYNSRLCTTTILVTSGYSLGVGFGEFDAFYAQMQVKAKDSLSTSNSFGVLDNALSAYLFKVQNNGSIGIGTTSAIVASAKVQIDSTTQGFLPPRMTNAQRTAIASPAVGLMVYCTDLVEGLYVYKSMGWTFVI